jgi:hypothetical protein
MNDIEWDRMIFYMMILNDTVLHHRLVATTFLRAPKPVKGQKKVKAQRNLEGTRTGTPAPADDLTLVPELAAAAGGSVASPAPAPAAALDGSAGGAAPPPVLPPAPVPGEGVSPLGVPPAAGEPFRCFFHTFKMPGYETSECSLGLGQIDMILMI